MNIHREHGGQISPFSFHKKEKERLKLNTVRKLFMKCHSVKISIKNVVSSQTIYASKNNSYLHKSSDKNFTIQ
jgi:hypothetical protein